MKKLFIIFALLFLSVFLSLSLSAQYFIDWQTTFGGGLTERGRDIAVDSLNNSYVIGYNYDGSVSNALIVKYDSAGNLIKSDTIGDLLGEGIALGNDCYYIAGIRNVNYYDWIVSKYDTSGTLIWTDTIDNGDYEGAYSIATDINGNVYATGYSPINGTDKCLIVKYDTSGNTIWIDTLNNDAQSYGRKVIVNQNVYTIGSIYNGNNYDIFAKELDTLGNTIWMDTIDNGNDDYGKGVDVYKGEIYITGTSYIGSNQDIIGIKYDTLRNIVWADTIDNDSTDCALDIAVDTLKNSYIVGYSKVLNTNGIMQKDYVIIKQDSIGNVIWEDTSGITSDDELWGITLDKNANIYTTGTMYDNQDDFLTLKYTKYKDIELISILSPDTVDTNTTYTPELLISNNSYELPLTINIAVYIDSESIEVYADTQQVYIYFNDTLPITFAPYTTPADSIDLTLRFSLLNADMDSTNDTLSKTIYVRPVLTGIKEKKEKPSYYISNNIGDRISYTMPRDYELKVYDVSGRCIMKTKAHRGNINLNAGVYFIRLQKGTENILTKKIIILK